MTTIKRTEAERHALMVAQRRAMGERLRAARERSEESMKDAAAALGISAASLGAYERGEQAPTFMVGIALCRYYGLSPAELAGGEEV